MNADQRGYLFGEVYPALAEGIDILLIHEGHPPAGWSKDLTHLHCKVTFDVWSTRDLTVSQAADYITQIQALAAECLIFIASPEEWKTGQAEKARHDHYAYVLADDVAPMAVAA